MEIRDEDRIRELVAAVRTVAVLGASADPDKPAHHVPAALAARGVRVLPVNPRSVGEALFGVRVVPTLAELRVPVDVVQVFRLPQLLPGHVPDLLAMSPRPPVVWLQSGISNDAFVHALAPHGIDVVQDRCLLVEHRRSGAARAPGTR